MYSRQLGSWATLFRTTTVTQSRGAVTRAIDSRKGWRAVDLSDRLIVSSFEVWTSCVADNYIISVTSSKLYASFLTFLRPRRFDESDDGFSGEFLAVGSGEIEQRSRVRVIVVREPLVRLYARDSIFFLQMFFVVSLLTVVADTVFLRLDARVDISFRGRAR